MRHADAAGQQLVFCNSYHLLLQPGPDVIQGRFCVARPLAPSLCNLFLFNCLKMHGFSGQQSVTSIK